MSSLALAVLALCAAWSLAARRSSRNGQLHPGHPAQHPLCLLHLRCETHVESSWTREASQGGEGREKACCARERDYLQQRQAKVSECAHASLCQRKRFCLPVGCRSPVPAPFEHEVPNVASVVVTGCKDICAQERHFLSRKARQVKWPKQISRARSCRDSDSAMLSHTEMIVLLSCVGLTG